MRERGIRQAELMAVTGRSNGHVSNVLNGVQVPDAAFIQAVCAFLGPESEQLFTAVLELSRERERSRHNRFVGWPATGREGSFGRQPAYWVLRRRGIAQADLVSVLGRSGGYISTVLNGHRPPDSGMVEQLSQYLALDPGELFTASVLERLRHR